MSGKSLYDVMGIEKGASAQDIKKAYQKLVRVHHPDKGGEADVFKEVQRAYDILSDSNKKKLYDERGIIADEQQSMPSPQSDGRGFPFTVNIGEMFGNMFRGMSGGGNQVRRGKKGPPNTKNVYMSLEQFYTGYQLKINIQRQKFCTPCNNTGVKKKESCEKCGGSGSIIEIRQMGPMAIQTQSACMHCAGNGYKVIEKCGECSGTGFLQESNPLTVNIKPGAKAGEVIIFPEACSDMPQFEKPGDAHIIICEDPSDISFKTWKRSGAHLETDITISLAESLMGCSIVLENHPAFEDGMVCKIPAGAFEGDRYCIPNIGMPDITAEVSGQTIYGNVYITVHVKINEDERNIYISKGRELLSPYFENLIRKSDETDKIFDAALVAK